MLAVKRNILNSTLLLMKLIPVFLEKLLLKKWVDNERKAPCKFCHYHLPQIAAKGIYHKVSKSTVVRTHSPKPLTDEEIIIEIAQNGAVVSDSALNHAKAC
jgi:hypothetical protein